MKSFIRSKTIWGIVTFAVGVILQALGFSPSAADFLSDGFQVADLPVILELAGVILAAVGIRTAEEPISFSLKGAKK